MAEVAQPEHLRAYWDALEARPARPIVQRPVATARRTPSVARARTTQRHGRPRRERPTHSVDVMTDADKDATFAGVLRLMRALKDEADRLRPAMQRHPCATCGQLAAMWWELECLRCEYGTTKKETPADG